MSATDPQPQAPNLLRRAGACYARSDFTAAALAFLARQTQTSRSAGRGKARVCQSGGWVSQARVTRTWPWRKGWQASPGWVCGAGRRLQTSGARRGPRRGGLAIGQRVREALEREGLQVRWNGRADSRIAVSMEWKKSR